MVLDTAQRHAMLQTTHRGVDFAHELIARAIYNDISPLRRQVMHRHVAELLERDAAQDLARAADRAHHATLSGDPGRGAKAMVSAGRLCLRFFANDDAMTLARKGLQLAEVLPDAARVSVEIDLQDILLAARPLEDREAAANHFAALAEKALDHGALAHARLGYHMAAWLRWTQGQWSAAREQTLQAARGARGGQHEAQIVGTAETAKCLVLLERDMTRADAMLSEVSTLARRKDFNHHAIAAGLGMMRFHEDRLDEAEEYFREARTLCKSAGDRVNEYQAVEYLVMLDFHRGKLDQARTLCEELLLLGNKLRGGSEEPFARAMAGLCTYAINDQEIDLEAALSDLRTADAKYRLTYILTRAALLDCERGRAGSATTRATEALGYATLLERATGMLLASAVLSHSCSVLGDVQGAAGFSRAVAGISAVAPAILGPGHCGNTDTHDRARGASGGTMREVLVERHWDEPRTEADLFSLYENESACLQLHRVNRKYSVVSASGHDAFCHYSALDAESVRLALRQAGTTRGIVWAGTVQDARFH
ncbi:MAG: hypothetical protein ACOH2H_13260 [Cypionkella sp.]